jgi:hypothetical protein
VDFEIFKSVSDEELCEIFKDILKSEELGIRPRSLDEYSQKLKEMCKFDMLPQAFKFAEELYYREIAKRYFKRK